MNKLIFGALAFAAGVFVEKKYGVTDCIMGLTNGIADHFEELEESEEDAEVVMASSSEE